MRLGALAALGLTACKFSVSSTPGDGGRDDVAIDVAGDVAIDGSVDAAIDSTVDGAVDSAIDAGSSTKRRMQLTFANASRAENLTDITVLVRLTTTRFDYTLTLANGDDLRFYDADDTTPLAYEIEKWVPGGNSVIWVRVPKIDASSNTDSIWMHWGDTAATAAQNPAGTWSSEHLGVWHCGQDPGPGGAGDIKDSTSNARHGTAAATMNANDSVGGKIGIALRFDTAMEHVYAGQAVALSRFTWSAWINPVAVPSGSAGNTNVISDGDSTFNFAWDHGLAAFRGAMASNDGSVWTSQSGGASWVAGTWYRMSGTYDGVQLCMYRDGMQVGCTAANSPGVTTAPFSFGGAPDGGGTFFGNVDEVRLSNADYTAVRINAEHASEADNLITFGTAQVVP